MLNKFPLWKNILLIVVLVLAMIYALPNLYGEDPSIQITGNTSQAIINNIMADKIKNALYTAGIHYKAVEVHPDDILIRFHNTDAQFKALPLLRGVVGNQYTAAVNLAPGTPAWLRLIGAKPMKKGLDLQGGIHFLLDVDVPSAISKRLDGIMREMTDQLRQERLRYDGISKNQSSISINFKDQNVRDQAEKLLKTNYPDLIMTTATRNNQYQIIARLAPSYLQEIRQYTIDQTLTTLRNRVNELGISEPLVQQQGAERISVDLPGVQDSAQAKQILGGTATLEFHLVDESHDLGTILSSGIAPPGTRLYTMTDGAPILLKNQIVLSGTSITSATASFGEDGKPTVEISLGGGGESYFSRVTRDNIGQRLAIVYVESKTITQTIDGKPQKIYKKDEHVISAPIIQETLTNRFQITGLDDAKEARNLALLLRAGAMPVNVNIVEERTIGASLGQENIRLGMLSVIVAFILIVIFMALYYNIFGILADIALLLNLLLIMAILSILGATLTLPGIAGIVLTVGMAVDANVLIFERIREELRNGASTQASIHAGFERAFGTIVDANVTTLIVAIVLFSIGSGPIKGFAITLTIGLLTSMFTAITFTRGLVNGLFGGKSHVKLPIGITI